MRRQKYVPLGKAIEEWITQNSVRRKLDEASIINNWSDFAGSYIAKYTQKLWITDSVLHVKVLSSVLKHELMLNRKALLDKINKKFNRNLITDIKLD